jgi:hypothetical protein
MIGVAVFIAYPVESGPQGRWTLPLDMALPLVAAALIDHRGETLGAWPRRLCTGGIVAIGLVHVLALWTAARRYAVGVNGDAWFLGSSQWRPPLGWAPWIIATLVAFTLLVWGASTSSKPIEQVAQP